MTFKIPAKKVCSLFEKLIVEMFQLPIINQMV
ncbi:hypothetical protein ABIC45_003365 [Mucilaginibacter rubeus]